MVGIYFSEQVSKLVSVIVHVSLEDQGRHFDVSDTGRDLIKAQERETLAPQCLLGPNI